MNKLIKKERRIIIVLMIINFFALFSNILKFNASFPINYNREGNFYVEKRVYLLTDKGYNEKSNNKRLSAKNKEVYKENFWPFVHFSKKIDNRTKASFRGLFPEYDYTEFIFYTFIIFGFFLVKKIW